ncbi:MAG: type II toxin-antitoxin system HicA family toxin [Planctomycetota bacterium]
MPSPIPFRKVRKLLESAGWKLDHVRGSHHIFRRPGQGLISIPVHRNQVKAHYAKIAQKAADEAKGQGQDAG